MSTIIPLESGGFRVYTKGASEIIMKKCSFLVGDNGKVRWCDRNGLLVGLGTLDMGWNWGWCFRQMIK